VKKAVNKLSAWVQTHRPLALIIVLLIVAFGVGVWRDYDDKKDSPQTETVEEDVKFNIGWSNLILLGVCVAALGVVKYKKSLKTDDDIKESKKDED
jgi:F0F1-type ATP synthase assembly protein I